MVPSFDFNVLLCGFIFVSIVAIIFASLYSICKEKFKEWRKYHDGQMSYYSKEVNDLSKDLNDLKNKNLDLLKEIADLKLKYRNREKSVELQEFMSDMAIGDGLVRVTRVDPNSVFMVSPKGGM